MQQQQPAMMNMMPPFPPANITTEQIQKYLDENKKLIMAILDNQNLGKLAECAQYQTQLQKNLMYLAAIADAQPQAPPMPSQVPTHPSMQQGGHYMQHPHPAAMGQQPSGFPSKMPMQFNPHQMQDQQQLQHQQQQAVHSHMVMRPGVSNGMQGMHAEVNTGIGSSGPSSTCGITDFSRGGAIGVGAAVGGGSAAGGASGGAGGAGASSSAMDVGGVNQDGVGAGPGDAQAKATAGNSNANGEPSYVKGSEDA